MVEELNTLLKIRQHIQLQIELLHEQNRFCSSINGSLSPFINTFLNKFKEHINETKSEQNMIFLREMINIVEQQIKSVCKHEYEEDTIDIACGCYENTKNITYCSICYSTF